MLKARGGNDFEVEHSVIERMQKREELIRAVGIDKDTYKVALAWWMDAEKDSAAD